MYVCLDLETTGLNPKNDHIIEVAIILFDDNKIIEEWTTLVRPPVPIPAFTTHLTGITNEMIKDAPLLKDVLPTVIEKVGDHPIMGHFIFFDVNFLNEYRAGLQNTQLDTCQLAQSLLHKEASYSLEVLVKKLGIVQENAHRAIHDVKANIDLFWRLCAHVRALSAEEKSAILPILQKSDWPWASVLLRTLEQDVKLTDQKIEQANGGTNTASEEHVDLLKKTASLQTPFLCEEGSYTHQDLLNFALTKKEECTLVVPYVQSLPPHPDLGILKHPNQYLDEERLKRFLEKDRLDTSQTMLGMKVSLWLFQTENGEKTEIRLVKDEASTWYDICCQEENESRSFFKKAEENASKKKALAVSQLHFLKDRGRKDPALAVRPHTIIGDAEELIRTVEMAWHIRLSEARFINDLKRLQDENPAHEEVVDKLAYSVSILFGFLGIFLKKYGTPNDPRHPLVIEAWHINTAEWSKVKMSADSIETAVSALGDDCQKTPTLDELTRYLVYLSKILRTGNPILWMTFSANEEPIVHSFPENPSEVFEERVWKDLNGLALFCHHADLKDNFAFIKKELALPENIQTLKVEKTLPLPLEYPEHLLPSPNDSAYISDVIRELKRIIPEVEGNIMILVNAQNVAEQLFYKLSDFTKEKQRKLFVQFMSGGLGKIVKMAENTNGKNIFVGNEDLFDMLNLEGMPLKFLAIHRLPFANPTDPIQMGRAKAYTDTHKQFTLPQAALRFHGLITEFLGNEWKDKRILVLDPRIHDYSEFFY